MTLSTVDKDPDAILPYTINWVDWLDTDTIASSSWAVSGPDALLVVDSDTNTATAATAKLSAGTAGRTYTLTNHIITAGGYADDRSISVTMVER